MGYYVKDWKMKAASNDNRPLYPHKPPLPFGYPPMPFEV